MAVEPKEYTKLAAGNHGRPGEEGNASGDGQNLRLSAECFRRREIKGMLQQMGFGFTEDQEEADFILFNTCAIRGACGGPDFRQRGSAEIFKAQKSLFDHCPVRMHDGAGACCGADPEKLSFRQPGVWNPFPCRASLSWFTRPLPAPRECFSGAGEDTIDENIPVRRMDASRPGFQ